MLPCLPEQGTPRDAQRAARAGQVCCPPGHRYCNVGALLLFVMATNLLVQWLEPLVADVAFRQLMKALEKVMLHCDGLLLVWWTFFSTYKAIVDLHRE